MSPFILYSKIKSKYRKVTGNYEKGINESLKFEDKQTAEKVLNHIEEINKKYYPKEEYQKMLDR